MRYLVFDKTDRKSVENYEILYQGMQGSMRPINKLETRIVSRILDKFEAFGIPTDDGNGAKFALSKSGTVELEDSEYKLMSEILDSVSWNVKYSRRAAQGLDWFENASSTPTVDAEAKV